MPRLVWSSDWHLVDTIPRCRLDEDWYGFLDRIMKFIVKTANDKNAILGIGGDLFGRRSPNISSYLLSMFIKNVLQVKKGTRILAGNHDEYFHNFDYISKTSFGVLDAFIKGSDNNDKLSYIDDLGTWLNFNEDIVNPGREIVFIHRLVFNSIKNVPPNVQASTAQDLLNEFPKAKMILTGDNHTSFIYKKNGRMVINPGSIYRGDVSQKDIVPTIYYIDTEKEIVEEIKIPDNEKMVEDSYIIERDMKENRISAFVEKLRNNESVNLDFLENIENGLLANKKLSKDTVKMIRFLCEEEK